MWLNIPADLFDVPLTLEGAGTASKDDVVSAYEACCGFGAVSPWQLRYAARPR